VVDWFCKNYLEIIGAVAGLIYLFLSVKQNIWLWPVGIITSVFYIFVFFSVQLYADMSLNVYYFIVSIYGWYHWLQQKDNSSHSSIKITVLKLSNWFVYLLETLALTIVFAWILIHIPQKIGIEPSSVPWWDAFLTAASIIATWMLARKKLEHWLWWIVIDSLCVGVFMYKNLHSTAILFVMNTIMAIVGYINWKKDMEKQ
jgi:nicotinamide mononucleotide transporter